MSTLTPAASAKFMETSARTVDWARPADEPGNSPAPKAGPHVQDTMRPIDRAFYLALRENSRNHEKSRLAGIEVHEPPGYRKIAAMIGVCARTALNLKNRIRETGALLFERRYREDGGRASDTASAPGWADVIRRQQADPAIAKTERGYPITRGES